MELTDSMNTKAIIIRNVTKMGKPEAVVDQHIGELCQFLLSGVREEIYHENESFGD